jgi:hypothetical protein
MVVTIRNLDYVPAQLGWFGLGGFPAVQVTWPGGVLPELPGHWVFDAPTVHVDLLVACTLVLDNTGASTSVAAAIATTATIIF